MPTLIQLRKLHDSLPWNRLGAAGLLALAAVTVFEPEGWRKWRRVSAQERALQQEIDPLRRINRETAEAIERLKTDPDHVETLARCQLGMIRPGEIVVHPPQAAAPR